MKDKDTSQPLSMRPHQVLCVDGQPVDLHGGLRIDKRYTLRRTHGHPIEVEVLWVKNGIATVCDGHRNLFSCAVADLLERGR